MDDRDFIYWLNGIFQFGTIDVLKSDQVDQIMENIMDVYDNVKQHGVINDFDSMRVISFIEGSLLYFDESSIEHKAKITTLIKNEITEMYYKFRDEDSSNRLPLFKQSGNKKINSKIDIIPLSFIEFGNTTKMSGSEHENQLDIFSEENTKSLINSLSKIFGFEYSKPKNEISLSSKEKTEEKESNEIIKNNEIDDLFGNDEMASSLDSIADKIAARA